MIEKFTPEEIEILKKELAEMPKNPQKRTCCQDALNRLRETFKTRPTYSGVRPYEMEDAIFLIIDHTLANYELRGKKHKHTGDYARATYVNRNIDKEYHDMAEDIASVIKKYYHILICEVKE